MLLQDSAVVCQTVESFSQVGKELVHLTHGHQRICVVSKNIFLQVGFIDLLLQNPDDFIGSVEVKHMQHHARHVQFCLQKLVVDEVALNMSIDGLLWILSNDVFKHDQTVKGHIVGVRL